MSTFIKYANVDPFSGISNIPYVGRKDLPIKFGDRWANLTTITLNGVVTGDCSHDLAGLIQNQRTLVNNFSRDHQSLVINDEGIDVLSLPYCTIRDIEFQDSKYVRLVPYTITIDSFPPELFSGYYGVNIPSSNIDYNETDDGFVEVTRNLSAVGFNTDAIGNNALQNAKNWVSSRTGWNNSYASQTLPKFIGFSGQFAPCLKKISETTDRFQASYAVEESYSFNPKARNNYLLRYEFDIQYNDEEGIYTVSMNGSLEGCPDQSLSLLRSDFNSLDLYSITNTAFKKAYPTAPNLNPDWLVENIAEDGNKKAVTFSRTYDTDIQASIIFDHNITSDYDLLLDRYVININGVIKGRKSQKTRWERVSNYFNTLNIPALVQSFYIEQGYPYSLVQIPTNYQVIEDKFNGTISISATYDDRPQPPLGFEKFDYVISVKPSIRQKLPIPVLCCDYVILDINCPSLSTISIRGSAVSNTLSDQVDSIRALEKAFEVQYIENPNQYRTIKEDQVSTSLAPQGKNYNFSRSSQYEGPIFDL